MNEFGLANINTAQENKKKDRIDKSVDKLTIKLLKLMAGKKVAMAVFDNKIEEIQREINKFNQLRGNNGITPDPDFPF